MGGVPVRGHPRAEIVMGDNLAHRELYNGWQCEDCGETYGSENNLEHHRLTHLPLTVPCLACPRRFGTYFAMVIHLQAGTCPSGTNLKSLNRLAAICFQWKKYLSKEYRSQLLASKDDYRQDPGQCPFRCPTCESTFPMLSSLFQHIWSPACTHGSNGGAIKKLKRWLAKRLYRYKR